MYEMVRSTLSFFGKSYPLIRLNCCHFPGVVILSLQSSVAVCRTDLASIPVTQKSPSKKLSKLDPPYAIKTLQKDEVWTSFCNCHRERKHVT
jgi:hypothetical protein